MTVEDRGFLCNVAEALKPDSMCLNTTASQFARLARVLCECGQKPWMWTIPLAG
jgi:hypothetical protein